MFLKLWVIVVRSIDSRLIGLISEYLVYIDGLTVIYNSYSPKKFLCLMHAVEWKAIIYTFLFLQFDTPLKNLEKKIIPRT